MTITLITGANKGLGFETARRLDAARHDVWSSARDAERGQAAATELGTHFVPLDVTDDASAADAAATVRAESGHIDILINNAGITGPRGVSAEELTGDDVRTVFDTNVFGLVRVTHAFLPLLRAAEAPSVINVSSGLGSFHTMTETEWSRFVTPAYSASKSAVNMLTVQYAHALPDVRFNVVDPGYTSTDLNAPTGTQTVEQGTDAVVRLATLGIATPNATFTGRDGIVRW